MNTCSLGLKHVVVRHTAVKVVIISYKKNSHDWSILFFNGPQCWEFRHSQNSGRILWIHFIMLGDWCLHPDICVFNLILHFRIVVSMYCLFCYTVCCQVVFNTASVEWNVVLCTKCTTPYKISPGKYEFEENLKWWEWNERIWVGQQNFNPVWGKSLALEILNGSSLLFSWIK
jgi:hypothetical protein